MIRRLGIIVATAVTGIVPWLVSALGTRSRRSRGPAVKNAGWRACVGSAGGGIGVLLVLLAAGCAGAPAPARTTPTATAPSATTPAATVSGPMTGQELLWLQAVEQLLPKMNNVFGAAPANLTSSALASFARQVRGCSRELTRIGLPSTRLRPVYDLVQQACREYDKGAKCLEDAARMGVPSSSAAEAKFEQKVNCGFAASGKGSKPLAQAQIKATEIKAAAG
jgi:hypothetical protein